eukprot:3156903-Rhodomonas_salina.5
MFGTDTVSGLLSYDQLGFGVLIVAHFAGDVQVAGSDFGRPRVTLVTMLLLLVTRVCDDDFLVPEAIAVSSTHTMLSEAPCNNC